MNIVALFKKYSLIFDKNGFNLFMIGGTSRDYLLGKEPSDIDFTTDATPDDMVQFLYNLNLTFAKFGTVTLKDGDTKIEITTLRKESVYKDFRHPGEIEFVRDIRDDYVRRDFTINAIYIDKDLKVYDFTTGVEDLKNGIIRVIGDPKTRFDEDPLRILRALRFQLTLNFELDKNLQNAIKLCKNQLFYVNKDKVNFEIKRMMNIDKDKATALLNKYEIPVKF